MCTDCCCYCLLRYLLDVEARDNGVPPNVGVTILRITVTDVDDRSPLFDRSFYQSQILEGIHTEPPPALIINSPYTSYGAVSAYSHVYCLHVGDYAWQPRKQSNSYKQQSTLWALTVY